MSGDLVLAIIGLSLGAGSAVGWWTALWWTNRVPTGQEWLIRWIWPYVDDRLGATKAEDQIRADKRFHFLHPRLRRWYWRAIPNWQRFPARRWIADFLWAVPQWGTGSSAKPEVKRMARYIKLELIEPTPRRLTLDAVQAVRLHPSPEVSAFADQYPKSLLPWVGWALRTPPKELVFDPDPDETLKRGGYVRIARRVVQERVDVDQGLDGLLVLEHGERPGTLAVDDPQDQVHWFADQVHQLDPETGRLATTGTADHKL